MLRSSAWIVGAFLLIRVSAAQNPAEFSGRKVVEVRYEPELQAADNRDLTSAQLVKTGSPLDLTQVGETIDRLYATGLYQDVRVYAEARAAGVVVRFVTVPESFIGHVDARGSIKDPPNRSAILGGARLTLGARYDQEEVEQARQGIERELHQNGLFRGNVAVTTISDPVTHQITIGFIVEAGRRARFDVPRITGDTKLPNGTIIAATGWRVPLIHRWRLVSKALSDKGVDGIEKKYAKKDRLTASVTLTSLDFEAATNRAQPHLAIDAGPRISIRALESKVSKGKLRKYVPVYEEGAVDNDLLTEGARNLTDYFQQRGYPYSDVTFKRQPEKDDQEIIEYYITAGERRRLANVAIEGNHYFQEQTLREKRCFCMQTRWCCAMGGTARASGRKMNKRLPACIRVMGSER